MVAQQVLVLFDKVRVLMGQLSARDYGENVKVKYKISKIVLHY